MRHGHLPKQILYIIKHKNIFIPNSVSIYIYIFISGPFKIMTQSKQATRKTGKGTAQKKEMGHVGTHGFSDNDNYICLKYSISAKNGTRKVLLKLSVRVKFSLSIHGNEI